MTQEFSVTLDMPKNEFLLKLNDLILDLNKNNQNIFNSSGKLEDIAKYEKKFFIGKIEGDSFNLKFIHSLKKKDLLEEEIVTLKKLSWKPMKKIFEGLIKRSGIKNKEYFSSLYLLDINQVEYKGTVSSLGEKTIVDISRSNPSLEVIDVSHTKFFTKQLILLFIAILGILPSALNLFKIENYLPSSFFLIALVPLIIVFLLIVVGSFRYPKTSVEQRIKLYDYLDRIFLEILVNTL